MDFRLRERGRIGGSRGFTLIELMITMVLVVLLAAIAAPSIGQIVERSDARSTARAVANRLRVARDQAMSRGEVVLAELDELSGNNDRMGQVRLFRTTNNALHCGEVDTSAVSQVGDTLRIEGLSGRMEMKSAPEWLCFSPEGTVHDQNGSALSTTNCPHAAEFVVLARQGSSIQDAANDLGLNASDLEDFCNTSPPDKLKDGRYLASLWAIEVPFNGSIRAYQ